MNTPKHTPGPWVAQHRSWGWDIANGSDLICSGPEHASKNAQANAHLVAAAPAMYEALKNILALQLDCDGVTVKLTEYHCHQVREAQAALAQAEGK